MDASETAQNLTPQPPLPRGEGERVSPRRRASWPPGERSDAPQRVQGSRWRLGRRFTHPALTPPDSPHPRRFLAIAPWPRALIETVILAAALVGLSLIAQSRSNEISILNPRRNSEVNLLLTVMLLVGPAGCALWLALRLRVPSGRRWYRALPGEALL